MSPDRVPPTYSGSAYGETPKVFVWPCGCVTRDSRTGPLERDCGDPGCYRRNAPPVRRVRAPRP